MAKPRDQVGLDHSRVFRSLVTGKRATLLVVLLVYSALTILMTWPVAGQLGTHVPGGTVDLWVHRWTFWWVKRAIVQGDNPFYTRLLYHPGGVSLAYHNIAWLNIGLWLPLQAILGSNVAYSLVFLAVLLLNGVSMYLLVEELLDSRLAAFLGGLIYGFWPYTLSHYGHPNMMVGFGVPMALLYLKRTVEQDRLGDALLAGVFLALTGIARWQLLIMASGILGLYVLWRCLGEKVCRTKRSLGLLALVGLTAAALMAPLAAPVAAAYLNEGDPEDILIDDEISGQTDLLAYVLPTRYHPLWNDAAARVYENFVHNKVYVPFLGYTVLALALYGMVKDWKQARFWALVALIYVLLALGPQLRINGRLYPQIPMPYRLIDDLFIVRALRKPDRLNIFLGLPMGILASLGVAALMRRPKRSPRFVFMVVAIGGLILWEYNLIPYHTELPDTPSWYERLAQDPDHFAVLDLPMRPETYDKEYMFYQTTHRKPLVEGHVSRLPQDASAFMDSVPFLRELRRHNVMDPALVNVSHQLRMLAEADIRYIVLHKDFASAEQLVAWRDWLTFDPLHEDEDLVVYTTDPRLGRDFKLARELTEEVGLLKARYTPTNTIQGAVVYVDARWGSSASPGGDYDACLTLENGKGKIAQSDCSRLSPCWPTSGWSAHEIVRSRYMLQIPHSLEPGEYSLSLTLADGASGEVLGQPASLGRINVDPLEPTVPLHVRLGEELLLRGYDVTQSSELLQLTVYWQAQREMETSYKVFVHLVNPATEEIVEQYDAVPRRWTYPTTRWQSGEVVKDPISFSLGDVPPGQYVLKIGCYDPVSGERLPVYDESGEPYPGDVLPLTTVHH
jgi:hypothetical protein